MRFFNLSGVYDKNIAALLRSARFDVVEIDLAGLAQDEARSQEDIDILVFDNHATLLEITGRESVARMRHLCILRTTEGGIVGPAFMGEGTACANCAGLRLLANYVIPAALEVRGTRRIEDRFWEVVACREVIALSTSSLMPMTINHIVTCDAVAGTITRHSVLRVPNCRYCHTSDRPVFAAWQLYER